MMRWRSLVTAATIGAVTLTGCGDNGDDAAPEPTTTTTEEPARSPDSTSTTEEARVSDPDDAPTSDLAPDSVFALTAQLESGAGALGTTADTAVLISDSGDTYRSSDAVVWERGDGFPSASFRGLPLDVAGGPVGWVAVGATLASEPSEGSEGLFDEPMIAFSEDGLLWEQIDPANLPEMSTDELAAAPFGLHQVVAGPTGFVAVGFDLDERGVGWFSADGRTWTDTDLTAQIETPSTPAIVTADESGRSGRSRPWRGPWRAVAGVRVR